MKPGIIAAASWLDRDPGGSPAAEKRSPKPGCGWFFAVPVFGGQLQAGS